MQILLISQYFFPETGATSNRIYSLAKYFQQEGHRVRVIAEKPNHPKGIFFDGYENGLFLDRTYKGIPVTYSWVYTRLDKGFLGRIMFYLSFMISAIIASMRMEEKFDIVMASSPPLFVGISGWVIAKLKRAKFSFDVRDLWPEVAVKMGELNNNLAIAVAEKVEKFLYKKADLITAVTPSFKKSIHQKGADVSDIKVITNGTDPDIFGTEKSNGMLREHLGLDDRFFISYVGNIGLAQGLEHLVKSAEIISTKGYEDICFLIVGDGPKKEELQELVAAKKIDNVKFIDRVPLETASAYMSVSNILMVPLANDPIYSQFVPSKLFDSMAASKPVLLSVDGEAREILEDSGAGIYYKAEDAGSLAQNVLWLKNHPTEAREMGKKGRAYVVENFSREVQAQRMLESFEKMISN